MRCIAGSATGPPQLSKHHWKTASAAFIDIAVCRRFKTKHSSYAFARPRGSPRNHLAIRVEAAAESDAQSSRCLAKASTKSLAKYPRRT